MVASTAFALILLLLAGVLLDGHRRDRHESNDGACAVFRRRRNLRRTAATCGIAVAGVLVALWPLTPREPVWVAAYMGALSVVASMIFLFGVIDAWDSGRHYRAETRRQLADHAAELTEALEAHRAEQRQS